MSNSPAKRKYQQRTLPEKASILFEMEDDNMTSLEVQLKHNVSRTTLKGWIDNKYSILPYLHPSKNHINKKRTKPTKYPKLEKYLINWYNKAHGMFNLTHIPVTETTTCL